MACLAIATNVRAQISERVVDIPTRPGVTQRMVVLSPPQPRATVILFAGGHGGLQIFRNGSFRWGEGNFLVRSRRLFAEQGLQVIVVDAPSDRQTPPFLAGYRQRPEHVQDVKAVMAWARAQAKVPVWLIGTSRGTQSAAYVATEAAGPEGPDGLVLTATILKDSRSRPVPAMPLERLRIPVLVVHHEQDACAYCLFADMPALMDKLADVPRLELLTFRDGRNQGEPCEAFSHHGFNGLEAEVVARVAAWILAR
ncbi:MAG: alpha/beta hydrolase [Burkholderiaceae bacterium]|nr:alpha/beta hydrolase [Burkholderiaceae bacterium]